MTAPAQAKRWAHIRADVRHQLHVAVREFVANPEALSLIDACILGTVEWYAAQWNAGQFLTRRQGRPGRKRLGVAT